MLDPFVDTTQKELRETWKKVEELEKENKELREQVKFYRKQAGIEFDAWNKPPELRHEMGG